VSRKLYLAIIFASLFAFAGYTFAKEGSSGFEGKWVLNSKRSPNLQNAPGHLTEQFKNEGGKLVVRSRYDQPMDGIYPIFWVGIMTEEFILNTDGSETVNPIGPFRHVSKTTIDGNKMVTDWNATVEQGSVQGQWIRTLSDDGKELTLMVKGKCSDGRTMEATLLFTRK
jgi:hypothetical protein